MTYTALQIGHWSLLNFSFGTFCHDWLQRLLSRCCLLQKCDGLLITTTVYGPNDALLSRLMVLNMHGSGSPRGPENPHFTSSLARSAWRSWSPRSPRRARYPWCPRCGWRWCRGQWTIRCRWRGVIPHQLFSNIYPVIWIRGGWIRF